MKGRTTWYETLDEIQQDLDAYMELHNRKRPFHSWGMEGRTPNRVFKAGRKDVKRAAKARKEEGEKKAA